MKPYKSIPIAMASLLFTLLSFQSKANEPLTAHEHGSARLDIAIDNNSIAIRFESPAANIVGFEYRPDNDNQRLLITQAKNNLSNFDTTFRLEGDLSCQILSASANWVTEHDEDEEHEHESEDEHEADNEAEEGGHAEFIAEFELQCKQLNNLTAIEVHFFELFPAIEDIDVQVIYSGGQIKQELNPNSTLIRLSNL